MDRAKMQENTATHFADPQPGDRFTEMMSMWIHVLARIGPVVVAHVLSGAGGRLEVHPSPEAFSAAHSYKTIPGWPWVWYDTQPVETLVEFVHEEYLPKVPA